MPKPGMPHAGKWVAYYRVSTDRQGESGLGLEAQRRAVADYLNGGSWTLAAEYTEVESGKRSDNRPQLTAALAACKRLKAKLIVAKLDRLSRNVGFICALLNSGVEFVAADMPHANKMTLQVLAVFAEHERDLISARTKQALAAAKERGVQLGGPKRAEASALGAAANRANAERFAANTLPIIREIQASGVTSLRGVARALTARGVPSARGTPWSPVAVSNIIKRAVEAEETRPGVVHQLPGDVREAFTRAMRAR
jgi:DNA invertase Pin-like site-specific DNA recombinase